jgi:hypothetical protein
VRPLPAEARTNLVPRILYEGLKGKKLKKKGQKRATVYSAA